MCLRCEGEMREWPGIDLYYRKGRDVMKLEKVNDHQIRCTLTKADLADRQLKLSELAYGTDKAKSLFRDMMQQASFELGFEADNIPLMIEAIPLSSESIILIITKVEDPEELDTRFSNFAPSVHDDKSDSDMDELMSQVAQEMPDVLDLFKKLQREVSQNPELLESAKEKLIEKANESTELIRAFSFDSLASVIKAAKVVSTFYNGRNSLYKNEQTDRFVLMVSKSDHTTEEFNRICNVLSEYGDMERVKSSAAMEAFYEEHGSCIVAEDAIRTLLQ